MNKKKGRYNVGGDVEKLAYGLGWWEREHFPYRMDDMFFTISKQYEHRPETVAYEVYNNANLVWLVLQYNNIVDIQEEFVVGKRLRLPSVERVQFEILSKRVD